MISHQIKVYRRTTNLEIRKADGSTNFFAYCLQTNKNLSIANTLIKQLPCCLSLVTEQELEVKAENEKSKGNEAFRSADYQEALAYYNRSIGLKPIIAVYNNRAMTYIHLKQYEDAIDDCNVVLKAEPDNIKGM